MHKPMLSRRHALAALAAVALTAGSLTIAAPAAADGKQILENACTACHNLARVQTQKLTQLEWKGIVERMKGRGADVSDEDTSALVDYLVKIYGR